MYKNILVPLDGSKLSLKAVSHALTLGKMMDARITLFHASGPYPTGVYGDGVVYPPFTRQQYAVLCKKETDRIFAAAARKAKTAGFDLIQSAHATAEAPWRAILDAAKKQSCDLIVMASHGRHGLASLILGSEAQKVLTHSKLPVLVVH
jgi:nucleotide-binding universal stress UspA family protein